MRMAEPMCSSAIVEANEEGSEPANNGTITNCPTRSSSVMADTARWACAAGSSFFFGKERRCAVTHSSGRSGEWWCCRLMWIWRTIRHAIRRLPHRPTPPPKHILPPRLECSCAEVGVWRVLRTHMLWPLSVHSGKRRTERRTGCCLILCSGHNRPPALSIGLSYVF